MKVVMIAGLLSVLLFCSTAYAEGSKLIRLATTTSTDNSGLLDFLLPQFTRDTGYTVHVIAVGTGKALRLGKDGDVDVVLVHALEAENAFVEAGFGIKRHPVMYNDFILVGPQNDPADVSNVKSVQQAFNRISDTRSLFISRGDNSGTHKKELSIWQQSAIKPAGKWYREVGQGMGKVIQMASEMDAYTLTDRGTWLAYQSKVQMKINFEGDELLFNPYSIIAVNPDRYADINFQGARALIDWITSNTKGQSLISQFTVSGKHLFKPMTN